jgi:hypothetical protein
MHMAVYTGINALLLRPPVLASSSPLKAGQVPCLQAPLLAVESQDDRRTLAI